MKNRNTLVAILLSLGVCFGAFALWNGKRSMVPQGPQRMSMNADGQKMLAASLKEFQKHKSDLAPFFNQATKVECFRVTMPMEDNVKKGISGWPIVTKGPDQTKNFATRLGAIVLNADTYEMPGHDTKLCWFDPNVAFRIWKGDKSIDVLICFHCTQLVLVEKSTQIPQRSMGGDYMRFRIGGDFPFKRDELLKLCKEIFPNDPKLK